MNTTQTATTDSRRQSVLARHDGSSTDSHSDTPDVETAGLQQRRSRGRTPGKHRARMLLATPALAAGLLIGPAVMPESAPVPSALQAERADAAVSDCIGVARNTFNVTRGNLGAAFQAARSVPGCGDTISSGICWTSRQWWGGGARWVIRQVTSGRYDRC